MDMPDDMLKDCILAVTSALSSCDNFEESGEAVTADLKRYMDKAWNPNWHVVIGKNFGSFVTHETRCFLYFYFMDKAVMCFKAG